MAKKAIPSIHTSIQEKDGSVAWVWYLFFQWIAENAGKIDLSDYFTKEETEALLELKANTADLATVAFTGDYDDLSNKPDVPAPQVQSDWAQTNTTAVDYIKNKPALATVATSGSYTDLTDKPTIPAAQVNSDWNANSGVAEILNKPTLGTMATESASDYTPTVSLAPVALSGTYSDLSDTPSLATVATTGDYDDLLNKPTIPTVNNPTITITQGGVIKGSFALNQVSGDTIALDAGGGGSVNIDNMTITTNTDDEIQAVATINANTAVGATNPIYDWIGTLEEYNNATPVYCWSMSNVKVYTTTETPTTSDKCYMVKTMSFTIDAVGTNTITSAGWTYTRDSTQDTYWDVAFEHPDWVCYITDDCEATAYQAYTQTQCNNLFVQKGHEVIAFQAPTSSNNYTWCRKYADGWVEQGGISTTSAAGGTTVPVSLPVTMSDTNYTINVTKRTNDTGGSYYFGTRVNLSSITVSGFSVLPDSSGGFCWQVSGMAA